ncbi:11757_t:CDS:2 [Gigaspora margarita]|uniref:11757_t:CDS:1 n=1 Tax=Gigaspora margarita TaxID=4874 RepID=A0ABN7V9R7_GIGMA|nr:11757_t:CDS:2 [Gigaspora margarita]
METEEQALQSRKLIQKENFSKNQPVNEQIYLKRLYQDLNNSRTSEKDKNTRDSIQHKRFQKPKEDKVQPVESEIENFINLRCKHIQNKQSKMLNSLLDCSYNIVKIDRILDQERYTLQR